MQMTTIEEHQVLAARVSEAWSKLVSAADDLVDQGGQVFIGEVPYKRVSLGEGKGSVGTWTLTLVPPEVEVVEDA